MNATLDITMNWGQEHGGVPGRNSVTMLFDSSNPFSEKPRDTLYRVTLEPLPGLHHIRPWLNRLMQSPAWVAMHLVSVRVLPTSGARTIPRAARFCKKCGTFAGLQQPICAQCGIGTRRLTGFWDGHEHLDPQSLDERLVLKFDLHPRGKRYMEIVPCALLPTFVVRVSGPQEALAALEIRLASHHEPSSLALIEELLEYGQTRLRDIEQLKVLEETIRAWSSVSLVGSTYRQDEEPPPLLENEQGLVIVADDCMDMAGFDWRDGSKARDHLCKTLDLMGASSPQRAKRVTQRGGLRVTPDVDLRYLRDGGRSQQIRPFVQRGSTLRVAADTPWSPEIVTRLEREGMRHDVRGPGAAVSVCGEEYLKKALGEIRVAPTTSDG